jgi:Flp pilus assembly protein TadD
MSRRLAPYLVVIAAYVAVRMAVLGYFHKLNNQFSATFYEINLFRIRLAGAYLEKLIWPDGLSMYYAFRPTRSLLQPEVLLSLVVIAGLTVALWHWRRAPIPSGPLAWLGWLWTLLALLPLMNLRGLGTHVFADWYLYLPSVGFVLIVAGILDSFPLRFKAPPLKWRNGLVGVAVILLLGLFSAATVRQNTYWKDGYSLFSHGVKVSPNSAIHRANYAHQLVLRNRLDEAMAEDREAIRLAPLDFGLSPEAVFAPEADLGWMHMLRGETQAAEEHLRKATRIQPKNPVGHMRLGYVLEKGGQLAAALDAFGRAQELDPRNPFPHLARGNVFVKLRQDKDAIQEFQQAVTLRPGTRAAYEGLIQALERQGRLDEARHWRAKLLELP